MENIPLSSSDRSFMGQVESGRKGHNIGLDNGLTKINDYLYGTHKGRYYLLGADSGVGKTTLGDFMYVLSAWRTAKQLGKPIRIFYFSFEIGTPDKMARWASQIIFLRTGKRLPSDYILGRITRTPLTDADHKDVQAANREIEEMMKDITLVERCLTPTEVYEAMVSFYEKNGTVVREKMPEKSKTPGEVLSWSPGPAISKAHILLVMDHLSYINEEPGKSLKVSMDYMSKRCVALKNMFQTTIVVIQQFATELLQANRTAQLKGGSKTPMMLRPSRLDFGDSKAPYRDADVVFGLVLPALDMAVFPGGWSLDREGGLGLYLVLLFIMKNRFGSAERAIPIFLDGVTGTAEDLPMPTRDEHNKEIPLSKEVHIEYYNKAIKINQVCQIFSPQKK